MGGIDPIDKSSEDVPDGAGRPATPLDVSLAKALRYLEPTPRKAEENEPTEEWISDLGVSRAPVDRRRKQAPEPLPRGMSLYHSTILSRAHVIDMLDFGIPTPAIRVRCSRTSCHCCPRGSRPSCAAPSLKFVSRIWTPSNSTSPTPSTRRKSARVSGTSSPQRSQTRSLGGSSPTASRSAIPARTENQPKAELLGASSRWASPARGQSAQSAHRMGEDYLWRVHPVATRVRSPHRWWIHSHLARDRGRPLGV